MTAAYHAQSFGLTMTATSVRIICDGSKLRGSGFIGDDATREGSD
jgi:hypothetical protein